MDEELKNDSIFKKLCEIINYQFGVSTEAVEMGKTLIEDLGLEDLDFIMFIMELENEWGLVISEEDASKIKTVKDAYEYVRGKIGG